MTNEADRQLFLQIAREALTASVSGTPQSVPLLAGEAARCGAAFVTLHAHGDLRGCIGHLDTNEPLGAVVARCAVAAGTTDPRFPGVTAAELPQIQIEISILGPLEPVVSIEEIEIGRHGLVAEMGWHRGLLLPQVATEWRWDREKFAAETCRKAGLASDAWKNDAKLWKFTAEVFAEP
jgi:AmmeMemoRadiSam system protein A